MSYTSPAELPVLLVDDEVAVLQSWELTLDANGMGNVILCSDSREVLPLLEKQSVGVVVIDLSMPHIPGEELLLQLRQRHPELPVIISTGVNRVETAVHCMRSGATDYLVKPVAETDMLLAIRRALEMRELQSENTRLSQSVLSDTLKQPEAFSEIITCSAQMRSLFRYMEAVAVSSKPIAILGESGVGKELLARAIHKLSRRAGPYVPLNVAGLDDNVFADTLFGHVRGAFTGADSIRKGFVENAAHGTLFLDEIGDLSGPSQVKLLRLLQEREYVPLGADVPKLSTARIVVATNLDLAAMVEQGKFRRDLYYRLQTHPVRVPSLRERREDIPLLTNHYLEKAAESMGKRAPKLPAPIMGMIASYAFPGNVRELEAIVFDAVARHEDGPLTAELFGAATSTSSAHDSDIANAASFSDHQRLPTLREGAQILIAEAMRRANGNQSVAAKLLGISQPSLSRRLKSQTDDES